MVVMIMEDQAIMEVATLEVAATLALPLMRLTSLVTELAAAVAMAITATAVAAGFLVVVALAVVLEPPVAAVVARTGYAVDSCWPPAAEYGCSWTDVIATLPGSPSYKAGPDSCCGGRSTPDVTEWLVRG